MPIEKIPYYQRLYDNILVKCDKGDCEEEYLMKDRIDHYEKDCSGYKFYECGGTICKIKDSSKFCGCIACEEHDCYDIQKNENLQVSTDIFPFYRLK